MKKLVILGGGESGKGTAILGHKMGYDVFLSDAGTISSEVKSKLDALGVSWEEKLHSIDRILAADIVMKSPGIPEHVAVVKQLRAAGVSIQSEIEFAAQHSKAKLIGITGSNGKTTTTLLVHHLLKEAGLNVGIAGNIGESFAQKVAEENHAYYVLEISSFQLDDIQNFAPEIAVITNITPDHLDRYNDDFSLYVKSKLRITSNQGSNQFLLFNADDPVLIEALEASSTAAQKIPFGYTNTSPLGASYANEEIKIIEQKTKRIKGTKKTKLRSNLNET